MPEYRHIKNGREPDENELTILETYRAIGKAQTTAKELGVPRSTVRNTLQRFGVFGPIPLVDGKSGHIKIERKWKKNRTIQRFLVTCAQNNTKLNKRLWENMHTFAEHVGAEILVSRFVYQKSKYIAQVKGGPNPNDEGLWYDEAIEPYIEDRPIELAPGLVFWGNMNTLPTARNPLSGFDTHGGPDSGIFPHVRQDLRSVPTTRDMDAKFLYTTGTVTELNYIQKRAGIMAEFNHIYGFLVVEVDRDGTWFVRQVNAHDNGSFQDLGVAVSNGKLKTDQTVLAINPGDIHVAEMDAEATAAVWGGEKGFVKQFKPKYQFLHDVLSFRSRNHHDNKNWFAQYKKHIEGVESVSEEVKQAADWLATVSRQVPNTVVVRSNHDEAFEKWLTDSPAAYARDFINTEFFLEAQLKRVRAAAKGEEINMFATMVRELAPETKKIKFLDPDDSFLIAKRKGGDGIECGMHGHLGPNGARGTAANLARVGTRANIGHIHSASINAGLYVAGTFSKLTLSYTYGPSSWSHSMIVTYPSGKRTIITIKKGKTHAG